MQVSSLSLRQFRTYDTLDVSVDSRGMRIWGRNASGKTSILEAIVMLSTTRSPRAGLDREVVRWDSGVDLAVPPYARLEAKIQTNAGPAVVGLTLSRSRAVRAPPESSFCSTGRQFGRRTLSAC